MPEIISNTSGLIALDNIGRLQILRDVYGQVLVPQEVAREYGAELPAEWINIVSVQNREYVRILSLFIDPGEASTIALAIERPGSLMILDDGKARSLADKLNLNFTGLLGVLLKAKQNGTVSSLAQIINELKSAGFRIADRVEQEVLRLAGE